MKTDALKRLMVNDSLITVDEQGKVSVDHLVLIDALRASFVSYEPIVHVQIESTAYDMEAFNQARKNAPVTFLQNGFNGRVEGVYVRYQLMLVVTTMKGQHNIVADFETALTIRFKAKINALFESPSELGEGDVECYFTYTAEQFSNHTDMLLANTVQIDGVQFSRTPRITVNPLDAALQRVTAQLVAPALQADTIARNTRLHEAKAFSHLPKGLDEVKGVSTATVPVYRYLLKTSQEGTLYLYFSPYFAMFARFTPDGIPLGNQWIYNLVNDSLEFAKEKLTNLAGGNNLPFRDTLMLWLTQMDLRRKLPTT